jgi:hypothetical protein
MIMTADPTNGTRGTLRTRDGRDGRSPPPTSRYTVPGSADLAAGELALIGGQSLGGYVETGVGAAVLGQERAPGTLVGEAVRQVATGVAQRREQLGAAEAMELENSCTQSPARMPIGCCQSRLPAITPRIGSTGPG